MVNELLHSVSQEFVRCASYWAIASEGMRLSGHQADAADKYQELSHGAIDVALRAAEHSRTREAAQKLIFAGLVASLKKLREEMENDICNSGQINIQSHV